MAMMAAGRLPLLFFVPYTKNSAVSPIDTALFNEMLSVAGAGDGFAGRGLS